VDAKITIIESDNCLDKFCHVQSLFLYYFIESMTFLDVF